MYPRRRTSALLALLALIGGLSMTDPSLAQDKPRERTITITPSQTSP